MVGTVMHSPQTLTCSLLASQIRDACLAFSGDRSLMLQGHRPRHGPLGSTDQDPTMTQGGTTCYSHQAVSHYLWVSSSASLHCAHIILFLFPPPFLHRLLAPLSGAWDL